MRTAHEVVQDFLYRGKRKNSRHNNFSAFDLEKLLIDYASEAVKNYIEQSKIATNKDL
jgi:hypothetical protein